MYGSLLKIDLTNQSIAVERIPEDYIRDYIGASGLAARLLWDALDPEY
jgi:aldehyde:ferredoxin oxidoreductase